MICWMIEVNEEAGIEGLTFDDFLNQSTYFFSQRHHNEGLRFIFELYDQEKKGALDYQEFKKVCNDLGIFLEEEVMRQFFQRASGDSIVIDFEDFAHIMRRDKIPK